MISKTLERASPIFVGPRRTQPGRVQHGAPIISDQSVREPLEITSSVSLSAMLGGEGAGRRNGAADRDFFGGHFKKLNATLGKALAGKQQHCTSQSGAVGMAMSGSGDSIVWTCDRLRSGSRPPLPLQGNSREHGAQDFAH